MVIRVYSLVGNRYVHSPEIDYEETPMKFLPSPEIDYKDTPIIFLRWMVRMIMKFVDISLGVLFLVICNLVMLIIAVMHFAFGCAE